MRQIVSDTGPLLHLYEAASLYLLEHAGTITIPRRLTTKWSSTCRSGTLARPSGSR